MSEAVKQVNFRLSEDAFETWDQLRNGSNLKNDDLFLRMMETYSSVNAGVDSLAHAAEMRDVQGMLDAAARYMTGVLGKLETRHKTEIERYKEELEELRAVVAARDERADELAAQLQDARESEERLEKERDEAIAQRDEARARVDDADRIAQLISRIDVLESRL